MITLNRYTLLLISMFIGFLTTTANAVPIQCNSNAAINHMFVDSSEVSACVASGVGNIGQGGGGNDDFLKTAAGAGYTLVSQYKTFTQNGSMGTWTLPVPPPSIDAIGFKFGTGNKPDEWFVYDLIAGVTKGDWEFINKGGRGGGLSHLVGYNKGGSSIPAPAILGIMGIGLLGMIFSSRLRRRKIS